MRRFILFIFALPYCLLSAQSVFELGVQSGPEVNFPTSSFPETVENYVVMPGFNVGVRFRHNFGMHSFIWGGEYAQMRFVFKYPPSSDPTTYHPKKLSLVAEQFRLPLLYQINIGKKKSQFFINAGPCILFAIASRYNDMENMTFGDDENTPLYPRQLIKDINMGFMTGIGYSYQPIPRLRLFTEARFTVPLFVFGNETRTLGLSCSLGVSFKTKKKI